MHHKAHPFKVHNSVVFSRYTKWCNCQHYLNPYLYIHTHRHWLCWVFAGAHRLSLVVVSGLLLLQNMGSRVCGFTDVQAQAL